MPASCRHRSLRLPLIFPLKTPAATWRPWRRDPRHREREARVAEPRGWTSGGHRSRRLADHPPGSFVVSRQPSGAAASCSQMKRPPPW